MSMPGGRHPSPGCLPELCWSRYFPSGSLHYLKWVRTGGRKVLKQLSTGMWGKGKMSHGPYSVHVFSIKQFILHLVIMEPLLWTAWGARYRHVGDEWGGHQNKHMYSHFGPSVLNCAFHSKACSYGTFQRNTGASTGARNIPILTSRALIQDLPFCPSCGHCILIVLCLLYSLTSIYLVIACSALNSRGGCVNKPTVIHEP